jgi:protein-S-isoprenylcysteine O-methyltransferase Ste14
LELLSNFEIGLWTAWWFSAIYVLGNILLIFFYPKESWIRFFGGSESELTKEKPQKKRKIRNSISQFCWLSLIFYAIFIPINFGAWYFFIGLISFIIGMFLYEIALINYASTPVGEPVVKGLYRISRNPIYFFDGILWIGIGILTGSWVILLIKIIGLILQHWEILEEEKFCLEKYGESFIKYMQRVPRYFGFPKQNITN